MGLLSPRPATRLAGGEAEAEVAGRRYKYRFVPAAVTSLNDSPLTARVPHGQLTVSSRPESVLLLTRSPTLGTVFGIRMTPYSKYIFGATIALFMVSPVAWADAPKYREVKKGAPLSDVLAAWGEPSERIERSVKRELVWRYSNGANVVFKDGKVSSFKLAPNTEPERGRKQKVAVTPARGESGVQGESRDVLRDIVREIPSGADVPYSEPAGGADTSGLVPNPVPPPPGRGAPIAPGVVVPAEEQD